MILLIFKVFVTTILKLKICFMVFLLLRWLMRLMVLQFVSFRECSYPFLQNLSQTFVKTSTFGSSPQLPHKKSDIDPLLVLILVQNLIVATSFKPFIFVIFLFYYRQLFDLSSCSIVDLPCFFAVRLCVSLYRSLAVISVWACFNLLAHNTNPFFIPFDRNFWIFLCGVILTLLLLKNSFFSSKLSGISVVSKGFFCDALSEVTQYLCLWLLYFWWFIIFYFVTSPTD